MEKMMKRAVTISGKELYGVDFKITVEMRTREFPRVLARVFDPFADSVAALVLTHLAHLKDTEFKSDKKK